MGLQTEFDAWKHGTRDALQKKERDEALRAAGIRPAKSGQARHEFTPVRSRTRLYQLLRRLFS